MIEVATKEQWDQVLAENKGKAVRGVAGEG